MIHHHVIIYLNDLDEQLTHIEKDFDMLSIGLMSGTSMDGIDAALLETDGSADVIKDLGHVSISYDPRSKILLKAAEYAVRKHVGDMGKARSYYPQALRDYLGKELKMLEIDVSNKISELSIYLHGIEQLHSPITLDEIIQHSTELHVVAVKKLLNKTGYEATQIDVVGYHGQTLFHRPSIKTSVIVGHGQYLADQLGITVVDDFRSRDVAEGGQGAPFAPLYHQALAIRDKKIPVAIVNCGGIANITLIKNSNELDLIGFDPGPGNGLIDRLIRQRTQGKENMDTDGQYGKNGQVNEQVLKALYEKSLIKDGKNYFLTQPPKSLDIGDIELISELDSLSIEDACATLEAFVADTIINSLKLLDAELPPYWILAGGGWHNPVIRHELENRLNKKFGKSVQVLTADEAGWNSQAMEAQIFAYFAIRSLQNKPLSVPGTTGVPKPLSGGQAYLPNIGPTEAVKKLVQANIAVLSGYKEI